MIIPLLYGSQGEQLFGDTRRGGGVPTEGPKGVSTKFLGPRPLYKCAASKMASYLSLGSTLILSESKCPISSFCTYVSIL